MWYESEVRILGRGGFTSSDGGRERGRPKEEGTMKRISQNEVCVKTPLKNLLFCILIQQMYFKVKIFKLKMHTPVSFEHIHLGRCQHYRCM